jgi:hypothetical protein
MELERLEFTLTTKCNSQCLHCQANASPSMSDVMRVSDAHSYLEEAVSVSELESFMVFGGEPMLYPERVVAIVRRAKRLGLPSIEMLTNGVWGKNYDSAEKLALGLEKAGLDTVGVSVDAFHLSHIPLEFPRNAAMALVKAGVQDVSWNVTVVESMDAMNEFDVKTAEILKILEPVGIEAHIHKTMPVGRTLHSLRGYFRSTPLDGSCPGESLIGNVLSSPKSICVEPSGEVDICWHLAIGNAKQAPLSQILGDYDWRKNFIIRTLVEEGPMGLLKSNEELFGQFRRDEYVNKCHLCTEARKRLSSAADSVG